MALLRARDGFDEFTFAAQMFGGLAVTEGAHGERLRAIAVEQRARFFYQALLEHGGAAAIDAIVKQAALRAEAEAQDAVTLEPIAAISQEFAHGAGRSGADLDGADELWLIVGMNAARGFGIQTAKQTPE